jgi:hypothetical protein
VVAADAVVGDDDDEKNGQRAGRRNQSDVGVCESEKKMKKEDDENEKERSERNEKKRGDVCLDDRIPPGEERGKKEEE